MFCLSIFSASQRSALIRFLNVPAADPFRMPALDKVLDMLRAHAARAQMPEPIFVELVGDQGQDAFPVVLRGERAVAVALAQVLKS